MELPSLCSRAGHLQSEELRYLYYNYYFSSLFLLPPIKTSRSTTNNHITHFDSTQKMPKFAYPKIYDFPPFFTKQPNINIWSSQLSNWTKLILLYAEHYKLFVMTSSGSFNSADMAKHDTNASDYDIDDQEPENEKSVFIFHNAKIQRTLKPEAVQEVIKEMLSQNQLDPIDKKNKSSGYYVLWKSYEEWGDHIVDWIDNMGNQKGSILTLYEIANSPASEKQPFYHMNAEFLLRVLRSLAKRGKCVVIDDEMGDPMGAKFI